MITAEVISYVVGSAVSLTSLVGAIWYCACAFKKFTQTMRSNTAEASRLSGALNSLESVCFLLNERIAESERTQRDLLSKTPTLVYINTNHVLMQTPDGEFFKLAMYKGE